MCPLIMPLGLFVHYCATLFNIYLEKITESQQYIRCNYYGAVTVLTSTCIITTCMCQLKTTKYNINILHVTAA